MVTVSGRVRVAVRLRPRNAEEMVADADFADCVELQPEVTSSSLQIIVSSLTKAELIVIITIITFSAQKVESSKKQLGYRYI